MEEGNAKGNVLGKNRKKVSRNPNKKQCVARNITPPYKKETDDLLRILKG